MVALAAGCGEDDGPTPALDGAVAAEDWTIALTAGYGFARGPVYSVSLDRNGHVSFDGMRCTNARGPHSKQVPPSAARELYELLGQTAFWTLPHSDYSVESACRELASDGQLYIWSVSSAGQTRSLRIDDACSGVPALHAITALVPIFSRQADIEQWIGGPVSVTCLNPDAGGAPVLAASYRLLRNGEVLGLLRLERDWSWQLVDCAESFLGEGRIRVEDGRWVLEHSSGFTFADMSPGSDQITLSTGLDGGVQAQAVRGGLSETLELVEAEGC